MNDVKKRLRFEIEHELRNATEVSEKFSSLFVQGVVNDFIKVKIIF
jgi:hypothetical protein